MVIEDHLGNTQLEPVKTLLLNTLEIFQKDQLEKDLLIRRLLNFLLRQPLKFLLLQPQNNLGFVLDRLFQNLMSLYYQILEMHYEYLMQKILEMFLKEEQQEVLQQLKMLKSLDVYKKLELQKMLHQLMILLLMKVSKNEQLNIIRKLLRLMLNIILQNKYELESNTSKHRMLIMRLLLITRLLTMKL